MRQQSTARLFTMFLVHHLESHGVREDQLRRALRQREGWLDELPAADLRELIPRLVRAAVRLADDPALGAHVGECFHFCLAGAGGLAATHAPTPALALETFGRFVRDEGLVTIQRVTEAGRTTLGLTTVATWPREVREQVVDAVAVGVVAALRTVCGTSFAPIEVRLRRAAVGRGAGEFSTLRSRVHFGRPRDELVLRTQDLTRTSLLYEAKLFEQLVFLADLSADAPSGRSPLRQLVEQAVRAGDHSIEGAAKTLQLSPRTLQRKLRQEGGSFREVLVAVRLALAEELLLESDLSIAEIAERLQYSDDKAFRKAFKKATGKTPSQARSEGAL